MQFPFLLLVVLFALNARAWNTPSIASPADGAETWAGVTLNWNAVSNSHGYQLQVDTTANFNSPLLFNHFEAYVNSSSGNWDTDEFVTGLLFGQTYYWRVRAYVTGDTSAWNMRSFTTRDYVPLTSPADGAETWSGVTLDWGVHAGVQQYEWEADTTADFNSPAKQSGLNNYINSTDGNGDTRHFLQNTYFGKTYYWRVRAINQSGASSWTMRSITIRNYVTLTSPADGASTWSGVTLDWAVHTGVARYEWQADTVVDFNSPAFQTGVNNYINSTDGNGDTRHFLANTYFGKTYYWRVRAHNAVDTCNWSAVRSIVIRDYVPLTSPADGASTWSGVTIDWGVHTGVASYQWQADTSLNFNTGAFQTGINNYINSTDGNGDTRHFLQNTYFGKTYYWRVRAINAVDTCSWSETRSLVIRNYVTMNSPANGAVNRSVAGVTLEWAPHNGVAFYQAQLDSSGLFDTDFFQSYNKNFINSTDGNSDTRHATGALAANTIYFWRVRAVNAVDTCAWTTWAFSTGSAPIVYPPTPVLISPENGSNVSMAGADLRWTSVSGVTHYQYEYDKSPNFTSPLSAVVTDTIATTASLANKTDYFWRARSLNGTIPSEWTDARNFSTALKISGAVRTETGNPIAGATVTITGDLETSIVTGSDGLYSFAVDSGGSYAISVSKNNDSNPSNGISTLDILLIKQHILLQQPLSTPYKLIAADVNGSESISTLDILFIRAIILANVSSFPGNKLWEFVSSDHQFSDPAEPYDFPKSISIDNVTQPIQNQNFIGIKLGDVNDSWNPNSP